MSLAVLVPVAVTDAMIASNPIPENEHPLWTSSTSYTAGDKVIVIATHRIYQSVAENNLNKDPTDTVNQIADSLGVIYWVDLSPTNYWAMFDSTVNTQCQAIGDITIVLAPGFIDAIYLGNLIADTVSIDIVDVTSGELTYTSGVVSLGGDLPIDYWEYFFTPIKQDKSFLVSDLIRYSAAQVTITISGSGVVKCGIITVGNLQKLGLSLYGAKAKPKTYSYINTDAFGNTTIVRRKATTDMSCTSFFPVEDTGTIVATLQDMLDVPCVWIANDSSNLYSSLNIFGLGSGEITYSSPAESELSLTVQGLI